MTTAAIPSLDVEDFKSNIQDFDKMANGTGVYTDRFGNSRLTLDEFMRRNGYEVPVAFASGIVASRTTQTVTYSGVTYHALATAIPFTTTGTFNAAQWEVISGVSRQELALSSGSSLIGFIQSGTGAVSRSAQEKSREIVSIKDFGATGDGVADDTTPMTNAKNRITSLGNGILSLANGKYKTTGTIFGNNISELTVYSDKPSVLGIFEGNSSSPDTVTNDPVLWVQKWTKYDNGTDRFAHNVGGAFAEVNVKGTGLTGANETDGTWMAGAFNAVINGTNLGTATTQDWDAYGNAIGVAGFAESKGYPGDGNITCGVWAYAGTPIIDDTTFNNLPSSANWATVGFEVNIAMRHKDPGYRSVLAGNGSTVGMLYNNYRETSAGVRDWNFGSVLNGSPNDGNFTSLDVSNWSGYRVGHLIDKIKNAGILFGKYMATGSYGIQFPTGMGSMTQRPAAGIFMGDTQLNWGEFTGTSSVDGDMWRNGQKLFFRKNSANTEVICSAGVGTSGSYTGDRKITVNIGGTNYYLIASTTA